MNYTDSEIITLHGHRLVDLIRSEGFDKVIKKLESLKLYEEGGLLLAIKRQGLMLEEKIKK